MGTTRRALGKARRRIDPLAKATFAAWEPFVNVCDPGVKVWYADPATGQPYSTIVHAISKELRDNYLADRRGEYVPGFFASCYHARKFNARKVEHHIRGEETHYYTSGQTGRAVVYLDVDAHQPHQVPDVPRAVELVESLVPHTFGRSSPRGWNLYSKVAYGGRPHIYNWLTDRLQAALKVLFRGAGISCDFETKGTITTDRKAGRLAKLPFLNWTEDDLRRWVETPTLLLPQYQELVEQLERLAAEQAAAAPEPVAVHRSAADVRTRVADRQDHEADRFAANVRHVMAFARRIRRVPELEEVLEHLKENNLFTGDWADGEARRESRVRYILDHYVEPTFDAKKCGGRFPVETLKGLVQKYRQWATRKYGSGTLVLVGGRVLELDAETLGTYLAICQFCLDADPHRGDGGIPFKRVRELWNALYERGLVSVAWVRSIYSKCRTFLDANDVVAIIDRSYGPDRSMRYAKDDQFPDGRYRDRQEEPQAAPGQTTTVRRFEIPHHTQHSLNLGVSAPSYGWSERGPDPPD